MFKKNSIKYLIQIFNKNKKPTNPKQSCILNELTFTGSKQS